MLLTLLFWGGGLICAIKDEKFLGEGFFPKVKLLTVHQYISTSVYLRIEVRFENQLDENDDRQ